MIYFGALFGYAIVATGQQKKMIGFYLFDAVFSLIAYLIFIPAFGIVAAAILTVLTETLITIPAFWLIRKTTDFRLHFGVFFKAMIAAIIMSVILIGLFSQSVITLIIVGAIVYFVVLYWLRGFRKEDILAMIGKNKLV